MQGTSHPPTSVSARQGGARTFFAGAFLGADFLAAGFLGAMVDEVPEGMRTMP